MKILLVNKFHYLKSGAERVYFNTEKVLEDHGHEVIHFAMQHPQNLPSAQSRYFVPFVDFTNKKHWFKKGLRFLYYRKAAQNMKKLIKAEKPDIVHLHNISHQLTYSIVKPIKKAKIPIVQTLHDYQLISPNYSLFHHDKISEKCKKHKYYNCFFDKCVQNSFASSFLAMLESYMTWIFKFYKKVDLFISPSQFLKDKFIEWGFDKEIDVVNNFLEVEDYEPHYEPGSYLVYLGRLSSEKGIMDLIRAIEKLPYIKLKIIGDGPQKREIENYLKLNNINHVELLGAKYGQDLKDLVRFSRFMVVPSKWYENYPMSIVEAMALGKPVLAAKIGGMIEMIVEDYNGWFFPVGNVNKLSQKIKTIYNQADQIVVMGHNANRTILEKNNAEKYYNDIMVCYEKVLQQKIDLG